jgi:hypothetical protein
MALTVALGAVVLLVPAILVLGALFLVGCAVAALAGGGVGGRLLRPAAVWLFRGPAVKPIPAGPLAFAGAGDLQADRVIATRDAGTGGANA